MTRSISLALLCLAGLGLGSATEIKANPIEKVLEMIGDLQQKVIKEGEEEQKVYEEFSEWCEDESKEKQFEIKTGESQQEKLKATIEKASADIEDFSTKVE